MPEAGALLAGSVTNQVTIIGLVIVLGAGVGGVLRESGVAQMIVTWVLRLVGTRGPRTVALGSMLACLVLVGSLGTLAGALAIAAPLLIPVAARLGYTRIATAVLMFVGGCAGLALAPFAGSNVAIMEAAQVGYGE
ncbi:Na+/H+ antiporter NhaC family protein, partial [Clavibacter michiganensis]|uniref:Na+/H+ antiporter NhaC family protein n=1 Tax=Clavibacter michiganensis TaxID=28447 RepID=UPI00374E0C90